MKKYLFVVGIILILVGAGWFISTRSKQSDSASKVEINDKGINISQNGKNLTAEYITDTSKLDLGISVYPKAELLQGRDAPANINLNGVKATAATYKTDDNREKVEQYFKTQIGSEAIVAEGINNSSTYRVIKSKTNAGPWVNVWNEGDTIYFTVVKPLS
jgi:hypothetical protein